VGYSNRREDVERRPVTSETIPASATEGAPPTRRSLAGLDWLNFFNAATLTGFGPFVAVYLTSRNWTHSDIGFVLTAGGLAGLLAQVPGGELLDITPAKRLVVACGVAVVAAGALVYALLPSFVSVFAAALLQGTTGGFLGPGIAAISLGIVGHAGLAERLGRNQRFAAIGGFAAAGLMGVVAYLWSNRAIFFAAAALAVPTLFALSRIRAADIHFARSCGAAEHHHGRRPPRTERPVLLGNRRLIVFATCLVLFQVANASIAPLIGEGLAETAGRRSALIMAVLLVIPQMVVALLAPWVGRHAGIWGRRPLLLLGFGMLPVRALLLALVNDPAVLAIVQILDGISGATLGVLTALTIADVTQGTGRFNLAQGLVGTWSGIGASASTTLSGLIVEKSGLEAGYFAMAGVALLGVAIFWALMPETRPETAMAATPDWN
jgi:MFS family permease